MKSLQDLKVAAYLDEASEEPETACAAFVESSISNVVLRSAWTGNICKLNDQLCNKLRNTITSNGLNVIAIISDLGRIDNALLRGDDINRALDITNYFGAKYIRVFFGLHGNSYSKSIIENWIKTIAEKCFAANIIPLYEITNDSAVYEPTEIIRLLSTFKHFKLLYDPVQLIIKQNINQFAKYWTLLKKHVAAVDVRDFKIGVGYKPVGFGDAKIKLILSDEQFKGWCFLEPSLGRRFGKATNKPEVFKLAVEAFENLLDDK